MCKHSCVILEPRAELSCDIQQFVKDMFWHNRRVLMDRVLGFLLELLTVFHADLRFRWRVTVSSYLHHNTDRHHNTDKIFRFMNLGAFMSCFGVQVTLNMFVLILCKSAHSLLLFSGVGKSSLVHLLCQNQVLGNPSWTVGCSVDVRVSKLNFQTWKRLVFW